MSSVEDFMKSPLVRWVQLFKAEPLKYGDLCDGAFLVEVMRQIDPKSNFTGINFKVTDLKDRLQNWDVLLSSVQTYYQEVLQQLIIMKLPDILTISKMPYSDVARSEVQKALLLILGCAIQCDQRQMIIDQITSLDLDHQGHMVKFIKEVKDCPQNILSMESFGETLDDSSGMLPTYIIQLLRERQENRLQIQDLTLALEELKSDGDPAEKTPSRGDAHGIQFSSGGSQGMTPTATASQLRKLRLELDEKTEDNRELQDELEKLKRTAEKLRNENANLVQEASAARVYRDELDIVQERANMANRYESENRRLREKLNELDFLRKRVKELGSENGRLVDSKIDLEEKLATSQKWIKEALEFEEQLRQCKKQVETISAERDSERQRMLVLSEKNARLLIDKKTVESENIILDEELRTMKIKIDPDSSMTLSDQLSEMGTSKLLRLELENQQLRKQIAATDKGPSGSSDQAREIEVPETTHTHLCADVNAVQMYSKIQNKATTAERDVEAADGKQRQHKRLQRTEENINGEETSQVADNDQSNVKCLMDELEFLNTSSTSISRNDSVLAINPDEKLVLERSQRFENLDMENEVDNTEDGEFKNAAESLHDTYKKYSNSGKHILEIQMETEHLSHESTRLEASVENASILEKESAKLELEVNCLQLNGDNLNNPSLKLTDMQQQNEMLTHQMAILQQSLESSELDRTTLATLEHDLEAASHHIEVLQVKCRKLEEQKEQLEKSAGVLELASKKYGHIQQRNETLEAENRNLLAAILSATQETKKLKQTVEEDKRVAKELTEKLADHEAEDKGLQRLLDRVFWINDRDEELKEKEGRKLCDGNEGGPSKSSTESKVLATDKQKQEHALQRMEHLLQPSANVAAIVTTSPNGKTYGMADESSVVRDIEPKSDIVRLERKNAILEEENRNLRTVSNELRNNLDNLHSQNSQLRADVSSLGGQSMALRTQLELLQADSLILTPRNAILESRNSVLEQECSKLEARLTQALDKEQQLTLISVRLERDVQHLSEQNSGLRSEQAALSRDRVQLADEIAELRIRCSDLSQENSELIRGKSSTVERTETESTADLSGSLNEALSEIARKKKKVPTATLR